MPLWAAIGLFLLSIAGTVLSFRAYFRGGGKIFLAAGAVSALLCAAALLYCGLALLLISSVD
jgi:cytochrome b subunit of formate dehydrogenase